MNLSTVFLVTCVLFCTTSGMTYGQPTKNEERVRRSPQPDQGAPNRQEKGRVSVDIYRQPGGGTMVKGTAEGNIYKSPNGRTRLDAYGRWSRVYGPPHGRPDYGAGINFSHRW